MMRNRIAAQLRPPVFEGDEDKTRIAGLLHVMLLSLFVIGLVLASLGVVVEKSHPAVLASVGALSATVLVLLAFLRRGHIKLAGVLLVTVFFANAVICVGAVGSIRVPVASFFILCVLIASLLLGYRGIVAVTVLSLTALGLLGWAEEAGLLPPLGKAGFSPYLTHMGLLIWTAVLLIMAKRGLDNALERARRSERTLGERNRRLEEEIAERRRAEAALRDSEKRLIAAQHIARTGDFTWDVQTGAVTWSDALFDLLGYDRSEHINFERVNTDIHHPDDRPRILEWLYGCVASGGEALTPNEYRVLRADGTTLFVRATGIIERGPGGSVKVFATVEDVTERKQAELALRESEEKYRTIFQSRSHGFYLMTDVFLDCNEQACRLYACQREDIVGHSPVEFSPAEQPDGRRSEDAAREYIAAAQAGRPQRFYWQHKRKDGVLIDCEVALDTASVGGQMLLLASVRDITERKRAEGQLQRLTAILEATSDLVSTSTPDLKVSYMNRAGRRLLGWAEQEMLEEAGIAKVHPQWAFELIRNEGIPSAIADGPWHGETAILGPEGEEIPVSQVIMAHTSPSGKVGYMSTIIRDIRERKEAEARVQEEKAFTDAVMNSLPGVFYVYEDGTSLIRWNRNMEVSTGFTPEELRHKHPLDWFDEADREAIKTAIEEAMRTGYNTVAADMIIKNGARVPHLFSGARLDRGGRTYLLGMGIDVTDRKRAEETLMLTQFAVDQASEGIFWMDPDGRFIYVNEAACKALGYSREELLDMTVHGIDPDWTPAMWQEMWETLRRTKVLRFETRHRAKDGRVFPVEISANFVEFKGQQYDCAFSHDITGRKAIEREREELLRTLAAKNEELESIIYVSSHDLRSPLINIDGFAGELQSSIERIRTLMQTLPEATGTAVEINEALEEIPEWLAFISAGVHKMSSLLDGLLRLCRLGRVTLEIQRVDAYAAFGRILDTMQYQISQAQANVVVDSDIPPCLADPNLFNQVFTNLLDNAIKYRDPGRPLVIHISGRTEAGRTVYEIADTGKGIAVQHQKKVFEVFHRLDPYDSIGGEGLGLTIVKRLLDRLGGAISMTSQPGKGTTFAISLPGT